MTGGWWAGLDREPASFRAAAALELIWERIDWLPVQARDGRDLGAQALLPLDALDALDHHDNLRVGDESNGTGVAA